MMKVKVRKKPVRGEQAKKTKYSDVIITQRMINLASEKALSSIRQCQFLTS